MTEEAQVSQAIRSRQIVELNYEGMGPRKIEPHVLYRNSEGQLLLSAYQISGYSAQGEPSGWKTFAVEHLTRARILSETFRPRDEYNPGHYDRIVIAV
jgi:WYL domain-containing protein